MILEAPSLASLSGIRHAYFTRDGGVSRGIYESLNSGIGSSDAAANVTENRARMARRLGVEPEWLVTAFQFHSPEVVIADKSWTPETRPKADAIVTAIPGLAIGVSTADCGPLLFADAKARVIGAAHAGWRGAVSGVLEAAVASMESIGARRNRIVAAIGPAINQVSYEVGPDFEEALLKSCPTNEVFLARNNHGRSHFDLPGFVEMRLRASGVGQIERQSACTYANESLFFSYRRSQHRSEGDYGRQISAIVVA